MSYSFFTNFVFLLPTIPCLIFIYFTVKSFLKNRAAIKSSVIIQILLVIFTILSIWSAYEMITAPQFVAFSPPFPGEETTTAEPHPFGIHESLPISLPIMYPLFFSSFLLSIVTFIIGVIVYFKKRSQQ